MSNLLQQNFQRCLKQTFSGLLLKMACVGILIIANCQQVTAQQTGDRPAGTSHRSYRAEGVKAIPFAEINANARKRIKDVVNRPSFYRRLPVQTIDADPDYFRLLVRRPELIVSIWQLMGVTQMSVQRTGPFSVRTKDGAGTISDLELIYGNDRLHVFYGSGSYSGSMLKQTLTGRCVIVLQTHSKETATGYELTNEMDIYLRVDNAAASLVTRTIQPLVGTTADHNFVESLKFVQRLNRSTRTNGLGVKGMGRKLKIDAQVRKDFESVVDQVFSRAKRKYHQHAATSSPTQISVAQQNAPQKIAQQVQVAKSQVSSLPQKNEFQPVVSPTASSETSQANTGSQFSLAKTPKPPTAGEPSGKAPIDIKFSDSALRPGVSVLVGGPRELSEAVISVADQSQLTNNSDLNTNRHPKRSTNR